MTKLYHVSRKQNKKHSLQMKLPTVDDQPQPDDIWRSRSIMNMDWETFFEFISKILWLLYNSEKGFTSVQCSSVAQSCLTLCDPMNCSTPGLPVHHQLPEFTQTHVHWVSDAIQPSHPLSSPFPPARSPSQYQSLFQWVNSSHEVAKVLEFQL